LSLPGFEIRLLARLAAAWSLYRLSRFGCIMYQQPTNVSVLGRSNSSKLCHSNGAVQCHRLAAKHRTLRWVPQVMQQDGRRRHRTECRREAQLLKDTDVDCERGQNVGQTVTVHRARYVCCAAIPFRTELRACVVAPSAAIWNTGSGSQDSISRCLCFLPS